MNLPCAHLKRRVASNDDSFSAEVDAVEGLLILTHFDPPPQDCFCGVCIGDIDIHVFQGTG